LKTLFKNLISNGIKYQPKESSDHIPTIKIWSELGESIDIFISDNGIGIDDNYSKDIFEPFKRYHNKKDYKGTGLGLSICKSVMEKHSGKIELFKSSNEGTTFKLTFPKVLLQKN